MRVVAVVYEPCAFPVEGVRVTGFVVEMGQRWELVGACPDRPIPLPPGGQVGRPLAAYALALGIQPVLTTMEATVRRSSAGPVVLPAGRGDPGHGAQGGGGS